MSLEEPDRGQCYAIAWNEFRSYSREDLLEWAVAQRAQDFRDWPVILEGYLEALAGEQEISYEDAAAHAIYTPEGVAGMREWTREHAEGADDGPPSPAGVVGLIERHYPGGMDGWRAHLGARAVPEYES